MGGPQPPAAHVRRRWLVLAVVGLGPVMSALDTFIVNVGLPSIRRELHAGPGPVELVVTAYTLTYAVLLITGGRLGDLFGRTRVYVAGMALFTAASALCGAAPSAGVLVGARIVQAAGAAVMVPQAYAVVQRIFGPDERVRAISLLTSASSVAVILAQVAGGALITLNLAGLGWRVVFLVNVPVGVAGVVAGLAVLPRARPERTASLDLVGVVLVSSSLLLLVVPMVEGPDLHWPVWLFGVLALSPVALGLFVKSQRPGPGSARDPLVELSLFRERAFSVGVPLVMLAQISNGGLFFVLALYLQAGRGLSPGMAGLAFAPLSAGYLSVALLSPQAVRRFGRRVISAGFVIVGAGVGSAIVVLHVVGPLGSPFDLVPSVVVAGMGQGLINSPLFATVLSRVRAGQEGSASGVMTTMQQTGAALGVAVEGLVFFSALGAAGLVGAIGSVPASAALERALWLNLSIDMVATVLVRWLPDSRRTADPAGAGVPAAELPGRPMAGVEGT